MASAQSNDDSKLTTTTAAVPTTESATISKSLAMNTTTDTSISANGTTNAIDVKNRQTEQPLGFDTPPMKNGGNDEGTTGGGSQTSAISPTGSDAGGSSKSGDITTLTTPGATISVTTSSGNVSFQTPSYAPRSKPLEKPKPLKLEQQFHPHHVSQSQILYHSVAAAGHGGLAALGGPQMLGAIPHSVYVGAANLHQHQASGGFPHNLQSVLQQHGQQSNLSHPAGDGTAAISTDEILETMEQINRSVKAGQFSTTLAGHIFRLYGYLKHVGEMLEQSHKSEMNRVFVSLRQACCRDSGQLGTPCRLKIMELVELRAMAWRPNLSHSQYYLNRGGGSLTNGFNGATTISEYNPISSMDAMSGGDMEQLGAAPVSAPPFGTLPINPFAFNLPPTSLATGGATPVASAAELVSTAAAAAAASMTQQQAPSYYLIPASHVGHTQAGIAFISPTAAATVLPPPPISPLAASAAAAAAAAAAAHHQQRLHMPVTASLSQPALTGVGINPSTSPTLQGVNFPKGVVTKTSGKYSRPAKIPGKSQYRDEVVIRNADSGKIMGVKGRRVAIIEELSKTIISFQKVPQGAKERTLTITGPSEEAIDQAKILIEETIRRNVSPARAELDSDGTYRGASLITACFGDDEEQTNGGFGDDASDDGSEDRAAAEGGYGDGREFTIEAGQLGEMLKLQCNDPALLEAAKQALSAYFRGQKTSGHQALRRTTTDAASRDQGRKERRKSMPTFDNQRLLALKQSSLLKSGENQAMGTDEATLIAAGDQENAGATESGKSAKPLTLTMMIAPPIQKQKASSAARSTPNLAATGLNKRALCLLKSFDMNGNSRSVGAADDTSAVETKFMADESGGGTLVVHEKKSRVTVRVVYTREFVLQCASSPFTGLTPAGLPWMTRETPDILRPVPGKFDVSEYKKICAELRQLHP